MDFAKGDKGVQIIQILARLRGKDASVSNALPQGVAAPNSPWIASPPQERPLITQRRSPALRPRSLATGAFTSPMLPHPPKFKMLRTITSAISAVLLCACSATQSGEPLLLRADADYSTIAESSDWRATSTHAETLTLIERLARDSARIHTEEAGRTLEDRALPLLIIADPPVTDPVDVGDRMVVFAWGSIHSGEVCGKPAALMLARELGTVEDHPLLDDLVILLLPLLNADGNDRMSPDNRPGQAGPVEGMGTRPNARGLNINRDFTKLETHEARALARVLNRWDPTIAMDLHTTNGSVHQYTLTYDGPRNPSTDLDMREYVSGVMLPRIGAAMEADTGYKTFSYGNLNRDNTEWRTYPAQPRYSTHYLGMRNVIGILSEAYKYASYEDRVRATLAFVRHTFLYAAAHQQELKGIRSAAIARTISRGESPQEDTLIALRQESQLRPTEEPLLAYEGRRWSERGEKRTFMIRRDDTSVATLSARLPWAYALSPDAPLVEETLLAHGVLIDTLKEDTEFRVEVYVVDTVAQSERDYEGHKMVALEVTPSEFDISAAAGTRIVRTAQPLGTLAAHLLEPLSEDGLGTWNFFDASLAAGQPFPCARILAPVDLQFAD